MASQKNTEEAFRRIERCNEVRCKELDLSHLDLETDTDFWNSLSTLSWLSSLDLSYTSIRDCSPLQKLKHLRTLYLNGLKDDNGQFLELQSVQNLMQVTDLHIHNCDIRDLTPIKTLPQLQKLDVSFNWLKDIAPLKELTQLKELDISGNPLDDLTPLQNHKNLVLLRFGDTAVEDITPLGKISSLEDIFIGWKVQDLTPLQDLDHLKKIERQ